MFPPLTKTSQPQSQPQGYSYFAPTHFTSHPLYQTTQHATLHAPHSKNIQLIKSNHHSNSQTQIRDDTNDPNDRHVYKPNYKPFTTTFTSNYVDESLSSLTRLDNLKLLSKIRKQKTLISRTKMKTELILLGEAKKVKRIRNRKVAKQRIVWENKCALLLQRVYRGYFVRKKLIIADYTKRTKAAQSIIRSYRSYTLTRIAKANRVITIRLRLLDISIRLIQDECRLFILRRNAKARVNNLRNERERAKKERTEANRQNAAIYVQKMWRGILSRIFVIVKSKNEEINKARVRVDGFYGPGGKEGMVETEKNVRVTRMKKFDLNKN